MTAPAGNITPPTLFGCSIAGITADKPDNAPHGFVYWDAQAQRLMVRDEQTGEWITFTPSAVS